MAQQFYSTINALASALQSKGIEPDYRVSILSDRAISIGPAASPRAFVFDFATETLKEDRDNSVQRHAIRTPRFDDRSLPPSKAQRTTGRYTFIHDDVEFVRSSLADLLEAVLIYLEKLKPGTLEKLSRVKKRTRRIVARSKNDLFDKSHLAKDHARMIGDGWWMGTNNSGAETKSWIRRACDAAALDFVSDITIGIS